MPRILQLSAALVAAMSARAAGDPVAAAGATRPGGTHEAPTSTVVAPPAPADDEPDPAALAAAPAADRASGVVVPAPREDHRIANTLLALPRLTAVLLLTGPRYAAGRLDDYLESRSPNAFGRDVRPTWRFGATVDYETALGGSLGVRVGRGVGDGSVDGYVGLFGARGQSGGVIAKLGTYHSTDLQLEPSLRFDAGREMQRAFAGVGDRGPRITFDRDELIGSGGLDARSGPLRFATRVIGDATRNRDDDGDIAMAYGPIPAIGIDETERAATVELAVAFDTRRAGHKWIREAAPSEGTLVRATGAYTRGRASQTGSFATGRGIVEARQLFDLFHGDRVLTLGARAEIVTAGAEELPFDRLPSLGGRDMLRAFARDELRDRMSAFAEVMYEWPLASDSHAYLFVESGSVQSSLLSPERSRLHVGYGGGIRILNKAATTARVQIAGADDGVAGVYLQLGAL